MSVERRATDRDALASALRKMQVHPRNFGFRDRNGDTFWFASGADLTPDECAALKAALLPEAAP